MRGSWRVNVTTKSTGVALKLPRYFFVSVEAITLLAILTMTVLMSVNKGSFGPGGNYRGNSPRVEYRTQTVYEKTLYLPKELIEKLTPLQTEVLKRAKVIVKEVDLLDEKALDVLLIEFLK